MKLNYAGCKASCCSLWIIKNYCLWLMSTTNVGSHVQRIFNLFIFYPQWTTYLMTWSYSPICLWSCYVYSVHNSIMVDTNWITWTSRGVTFKYISQPVANNSKQSDLHSDLRLHMNCDMFELTNSLAFTPLTLINTMTRYVAAWAILCTLWQAYVIW